MVSVTGWPVTVGVVEVGVVSQPGADAERYRYACLHCTQGLAGRGDGYQCGLDWGLSSANTQRRREVTVRSNLRRAISRIFFAVG